MIQPSSSKIAEDEVEGTDNVPGPSVPRKSTRTRKAKSFGSDFQLYLVEGTRDKTLSQREYCFIIEEDPRTLSEAMDSRDEDPCIRNKTPLTLSWERIPRLDSGVRKPRAGNRALAAAAQTGIRDRDPLAQVSTPRPSIKLVKMVRDTIQLEDVVSTISLEYMREFASEYYIPEDLHPELPGPKDTIVDFLEGKVGVYTKFFEFANFRVPISQLLFDILGHFQIHRSQLSVLDKRIFLTVVEWRSDAPEDKMPSADSYSAADVATLDTHRTPIQKQPETLLCLVGLSQNYFLGDDMYPTFLYDDGRDMNLFNLISSPNPTKVKTETRPRAAYEMPLLTANANSVIDMEDTVAASRSSETPSVVEKSPLDFSSEDPPPMITGRGETKDQVLAVVSQKAPSAENAETTEVIPELNLEKEATVMGPLVNKRRRKRDQSEMEANAPPKVLRKDHASVRPVQNTRGGKSLASMRLITEDPDSEKSTSFTSMVWSPGNIYQPGWGVTNNCRLDTPDVCQDMVDHIVPPGYFSVLRHLPNDDFLSQYNINLTQQVAMGSQLRLRFEQEAKLLKKAVAQVARRDQRIQAREKDIKNLEALLEAEADMKEAAEAKNAKLVKELESLRVQFSDLQVSNNQLSQQVSTLQA
ncbi:hypothetical protein Tco_1500184 [Tanacetum coccineum]